MQEAPSNNHSNDSDDEIDLRELFFVLIQGRWIIVSITTFISIIGLIYCLLLPNIYESKALIVPVNPSSSLSGALQNYSGLASLAGITIPSGGSESSAAKAMKKINSLSFFENNILSNIHLPNLMAVKSWNPNTNTLDYDNSIYNVNTTTWVRDYSYPQQQIPSTQESFEVFSADHLSLIEDKSSGFITLSIKHQSPFIAKQWTDLIIKEVNSFYRQKDRLESEKAVSYLNEKLSITGLSEVKQVLAELLQEETKKLTLIEANEYYVFDYIDPPAVMEKESEPKRYVIFLISLLLGGFLSIFIVLIKHYVFSNKIS